MRTHARLFALAVAASLGLLLYACESGSDGGGSSGTFDAGGSGFEAGPGGGEGGSGSDGGDGGSGDGGGGGTIKPALTTCSPLVDIDSLAGVESQTFAAASFNGKYLFVWDQAAQRSGDGQYHKKGRYFDGNAFTTEIDFGFTSPGMVSTSVDSTGQAFLMWNDYGNSINIGVFDLTTGTLVSTVTVPIGGVTWTVGALNPQGALAIYEPLDRNEVVIDRYSAGSVWSGDAGTDAGSFPTSAALAIESAFVTLNAAGKGVVAWTLDVANATELYVTPFDGTSFGATVVRSFAAGAANSDYFAAAALSNGDAVFGWLADPGATLATFHSGAPAGSEWDPDMALTTASAIGSPIVLVGPGDAITALYTEGISGNEGTLKAQRRLGGTWSAPITIGPSFDEARGTLDPGGNVILATQANGIFVARWPADSTSAPTLVPSGYPASNVASLAFAFDKNGDPVLGALDDADTAQADLHFGVTTCTTAP